MRTRIVAALVLLAPACRSTPERSPTLPTVEEGGPELPPEVPPRKEPRPGQAAGSGRLALGCAVAGLGDVNGDAVPDLAVGIDGAAPNGERSGAAWVVSGFDGSVLFTFAGDAAWDRFGYAVAAAGDVDADGIPDCIVGAPGVVSARGELDAAAFDALRPEELLDRGGYARVLSGADGSLLHELRSERRADGFGAAVACAGDLDRDGRPDLVVGAPASERVVVCSGDRGEVLLELAGGRQGAFGSSVLALGDLDGDGQDDLAVGSPGGDLGRVEVFSSRDGDTLLRIDAKGSAARFGDALAPAGDLDGDGRSDLLVGGPPVLARVFSSRDGALLRDLAELRPGGALEGFGRSVARIGDVDDDGRPDFAVGCDEPRDDTGSYYVAVYSGTDGVPVLSLDFGVDMVRVAFVGDVDWDGVPDLLVGFPWLGVARVYSGQTQALLLHSDPLAREVEDLGMKAERRRESRGR